MKKSPQYDYIDAKFVEAVDEVIAVNTELGITPNKDSSIGSLIYPSNRSIISSVRSRSKRVPHLALINFAREFRVDMNYFYSDNSPLNYMPRTIQNVVVKGNKIKGNHNTTAHSQKGSIKGINVAQTGSRNTLVDLVEVNTMINNFISEMDNDRITEFMTIVSQIQADSKVSLSKMEHQFQEKCKEITMLRQSYGDELASTRTLLNETIEKLDEARKTENALLREMLSKK